MGRRIGAATRIQRALEKLDYKFRYNLLRERYELADGTPLHDGELSTIMARLFEQGFRNKGLITDVYQAEAWNNRYDVFHDFFTGLTWDGKDHIGKLANNFKDSHPLLKYPDGRVSTVFAAFLRRWLIGAVAKAVGPAAKHFERVQNPMLVLAGDQEIGKTEFVRWLGSPLSDYFVESAINPESVEHHRWATANFIWEVAELGSTTRRANVEALKAFLSRHEHSFRVPYAKNEVHKPSRASFIGTVNPDYTGFLVDPTGNRRFLVVEVTAIDWRGYMADVDVHQVWAQAYALYCQDSTAWQLDGTERKARINIAGDYEIEDPVCETIMRLYEITPGATGEDAPFTATTDLVFQVGMQVKTNSTKVLQMDVARAMKKLGVRKGRTANDIRGYYGVQRRAEN